jgi:hypothetical protein
MNSIQELLDALQSWGGKTLADLRSDAEKELNGTAYTALKCGNRRALLAVCVTGQSELQKIAGAFPATETPNADWKKITLASLAIASIKNKGFIHEPIRSADKKLTALALIVTEPNLIEKFTQLMGLPS